jgi:hypothetical protein
MIDTNWGYVLFYLWLRGISEYQKRRSEVKEKIVIGREDRGI